MAYYFFLSHMIDNEISMHVKISNFYKFSYYSFFPQLAQQGGFWTTSLAWEYIKVCGYSDRFWKTWTKGHWPLDDLWPHICWGHMCDYPRIIVSKSHENTSEYVDTVTCFAKNLNQRSWPLDDLWPHICWGHMCDSTQGSLCPSPMKIHQSMWIQWLFLQKLEKVIDP